MPTFLSVTDSNSMNDRWKPDRQPISAEAWEDEYFRRMELLMEYRAVLEALDQLQKRERYILLARILEERLVYRARHRNYRLDIKARLRSIIAH